MRLKIKLVIHISSIVAKTREECVPIVREKYGKTKTFQIQGFVTYFAQRKNPCSSKNMGKVNSHSTIKVWENKKIKKLWVS